MICILILYFHGNNSLNFDVMVVKIKCCILSSLMISYDLSFEYVKNNYPIKNIIAEVKETNIASNKLFLNSDFKFFKKGRASERAGKAKR